MKKSRFSFIITIIFVSLSYMSTYAQPEEKDFRSNKNNVVL